MRKQCGLGAYRKFFATKAKLQTASLLKEFNATHALKFEYILVHMYTDLYIFFKEQLCQMKAKYNI